MKNYTIIITGTDLVNGETAAYTHRTDRGYFHHRIISKAFNYAYERAQSDARDAVAGKTFTDFDAAKKAAKDVYDVFEAAAGKVFDQMKLGEILGYTDDREGFAREIVGCCSADISDGTGNKWTFDGWQYDYADEDEEVIK